MEKEQIAVALVDILLKAGVTEKELQAFVESPDSEEYGKRMQPYFALFSREEMAMASRRNAAA